MKKKLLGTIVMLLLVIITNIGCSTNKEIKQNNTGGKTCFVQKLSSLYSGDNEISLMFYSNEEDYSSWNLDNIEETILIIGNSRFDVKISDLKINENTVGKNYHQGYMVISGELSETSGYSYLELKKKDNQNTIKYKLGEYSIVKDKGCDNFEDLDFECGGVVKTDENGEVFNYGIIMRIEAEKNIVIRNIDFGLDKVIIDNANYIIYDEYTYKNEIYDLIDSASYDKKVKSAYLKNKIGDKDTSLNIELKKEKYYIYFPLEYAENYSMEESVVSIEYALSKHPEKNKNITNSFTYFIEMSKNEETIEKMFK